MIFGRLSALAVAFAAVTSMPTAAAAAPEKVGCPETVADAACWRGRDDNGSWYWIAVPKNWNRKLVVHAHGGPRLTTPARDDSVEDLERFSVMVREGWAWIGTTYRRGGYGVRMAAEDVETSRKVFWSAFGRPERTILHGQSWGGNVAAKAAELYATDVEGRPVYDGVLLTNGVLTGGTRAYGFRADLRAVYQYVCRNHPLPSEPQYPLWSGLPADSTMTRDDLRRRVNDCTGVDLRPEQRTEDQSRRLADILAVTGVAADNLQSHLAWATFHFRDLVQLRLDGRNPFDNSRALYRGSRNDQALNAGVERFEADPVAVARLAYDADLTGLIAKPTLTLHALHDPVVSFAAETSYAATVAKAGTSEYLLQLATDEREHSKLSDSAYVAVLRALDRWVSTGVRPSQSEVGASCVEAQTEGKGPCRLVASTR